MNSIGSLERQLMDAFDEQEGKEREQRISLFIQTLNILHR